MVECFDYDRLGEERIVVDPSSVVSSPSHAMPLHATVPFEAEDALAHDDCVSIIAACVHARVLCSDKDDLIGSAIIDLSSDAVDLRQFKW